ncbi:MAG: hypothetical protein ACR5K4_01845 [Sodalis sp. (in: enterobacteria)]
MQHMYNCSWQLIYQSIQSISKYIQLDGHLYKQRNRTLPAYQRHPGVYLDRQTKPVGSIYFRATNSKYFNIDDN